MTKRALGALIEQWVTDHREEMVEELKGWVSHPSVSRADLARPGAPFGPDCREMLDYALERGRACGFKAEDHEGYCGSVLYGESPEEIGIVCHLDVVPEGEHWLYAPYDPVERDGFLMGRGVADNKGAAVLGLFLMRFLKENDIPLRSSVRLMLGCAEETGMADFAHYVKDLLGPVPRVSLVADANFPVCYAQKGGYKAAFRVPAGGNIVDAEAGSVRNIIPETAALTVSGITAEKAWEHLAGIENIHVEPAGENIRLTAHGKAGHAAHPESGKNAIAMLSAAAAVLEEKSGLDLRGMRFLAEAFASPYGEGLGVDYQDEESGALTVNAGVLKKTGGTLCLDIDIRYPVTQQAEDITAALRQRAAAAGGELTDVHVSDKYFIDPKDRRVQALMDAYRTVTGDDAPAYTMGGGTYSRVLPDAITFGPALRDEPKADFLPEGHGGVHGPDEALHIESWLTGLKIYIRSVLRLDEVLHS